MSFKITMTKPIKICNIPFELAFSFWVGVYF